MAESAADPAGESVGAGVGLVATFLKAFAFVLSIHVGSSGKWLLLREEWRVVGFARPPGQATRSRDKVVSFKQFSFDGFFEILKF